MGTIQTLSQKGNNPNKTAQIVQTKRSKKSKFTTIQQEANIKCDSINGNAIQHGDTIIYLSQHSNSPANDENKLDGNDSNINNSYEPVIKLNKYNLNTKQMISSIEINTSKYDIDISNSVYCLNTQNNSIYLINKNTQIFIISTNNPSIKPLNFIDSENNITEKPYESKNNASIAYYNNKVIVLGATPKVSDDEKSQDTNIEYIAYDLTKIKQNREQLAITNFGKSCAVIEITELERLILMGGRRLLGKTDIYIPSDLVWECSIGSTEKCKWNYYGPLYLAEPMHSFGIIQLNLKACRWLLLFGGTHIHQRKEEELPMNSVYAIYFDKKYEKLSIKELIHLDNKENSAKLSKEKNSSNIVSNLSLHGLWVELKVSLPEKANYFAFYNENFDKDTIHLISRQSGIHYSVTVKEVLGLLERNALFTKDGNDGTVHKCHPWYDKARIPIPTKLAKLKGKGPKSKNKIKSNNTSKLENEIIRNEQQY